MRIFRTCGISPIPSASWTGSKRADATGMNADNEGITPRSGRNNPGRAVFQQRMDFDLLQPPHFHRYTPNSQYNASAALSRMW